MKTTRADTLREALADMIISGSLTPGARLDEAGLAERFGVSRTPVREALKQLAATGLVRMEPHRGAEVARLTAERQSEMFEARAEIEALCARLAALKMTAPERRKLERLHQACGSHIRGGDIEGYHVANADFHMAIYQGCHNAVLSEMASGLRRRLSPFSRAQFRGPGRLASSYAEHAAVVEAILRGNAEEAAQTMRRHATVVAKAFDDYVSSIGASSGDRATAGPPGGNQR